MKRFKALLTIGFLIALATGCSTTSDRQNMLTAAGFRMVPADTPERQMHLQTLPSGEITPVQRNGTLYYVCPDPKRNLLYVGNEQQYQEYQRLRFQKQMTQDQLTAAQLNREAAWGVWGPWGGPGWGGPGGPGWAGPGWGSAGRPAWAWAY